MKLEHHAAVAVPVSAGILYFTHSWFYFLMSICLGVLIDFDHVFDYIREEKKFDFKDLFIKSYRGDFIKIYLVFHCYEYIVVAWIIGFFIKNYTFPVVFTVSYFCHMIADQFANNIRPLGYFFFYRLYNGFVMKKIFYPPKKGQWHRDV